MGMIIGFEEPKGGTGKSTTIIEIARALQLEGQRVKLYDSDYKQQTLSKWYYYSGDKESSIYPPVKLIDNIKDYERILADRDSADWHLIDGSSKAEDMMIESVITCDGLLMPCQPSGAEVDGSEPLTRFIDQRLRFTKGTQPRAAFLVNRDKKNTYLSRDVESMLDKLGYPVFKARVSDSVLYTMTLSKGLTVFEMPGATAVEKQAEIKKLTREFKEYFSHAK